MIFRDEIGKKERLVIEFEDSDTMEMRRFAKADFDFLQILIRKL